MATVLTQATVVGLAPLAMRRANIRISGGRIETIDGRPPANGDESVDCSGKLVIPGNVNSHTHVYSVLARGMPPPRNAPTNFLEILQEVWWKLDRALDEKTIQASARVAALDAVRSGTTTLIDHHASPNFIHSSLDVLADGLDEVGVRAVVCYEVTDRGGQEQRQAGLTENERFIKENRRGKIRGMVGAHASFTLEDQTLSSLSELAAALETGVHIHLGEDAYDQADAARRCGKRAGERLADAGVLNQSSIAAHCVHVNPAELAAIDRSGAFLAHNCRSNMNNHVGRASLGAFRERGTLGTDGIDQDMFGESRSAFFRAREETLDASAEQILALLARGAEIASTPFTVPIGSLEPQNAADLVVLDYSPPTDLTAENLAWHWMFALTSGSVESVMVDGSWVMRNREVQTIDEERVRHESRSVARRLWTRMGEL